jgi:trimeric autotransporter adhesin
MSSGQFTNKNTAIGLNALATALAGVPGFDNSAYGWNALASLPVGKNESTAFGSGALRLATGGENSAFGAQASANNGPASGNSAFGNWALRYVGGNENTAMGFRSMAADKLTGTDPVPLLSTGNRNSAFGAYTMQNQPNGSDNLALGWSVMKNITTGSSNNGSGSGALSSLTTGSNNVANGYQSLSTITTGANNTATGVAALTAATLSSSNNSAFGFNALSAVTTGGSNTAVGNVSGVTVTTGSNNTFIGAGADSSAAAGAFRTAIGAGALASQDNTVVLGRTTDKIGVGTSTPSSQFQVVGNGTTDAMTISHPSTAMSGSGTALFVNGGIRHKTVITPLVPFSYSATINDYIIIATVGSTTTQVVLPDPATIPAGQTYVIRNAGPVNIVVNTVSGLVDDFVVLSAYAALDNVASGASGTFVSANDNVGGLFHYYRIA